MVFTVLAAGGPVEDTGVVLRYARVLVTSECQIAYKSAQGCLGLAHGGWGMALDPWRQEHAKNLFFKQATSYYVSGRYAALSRLAPVAGNLLHHAVEMYLKGALSPSLDQQGLRDLGHNLRRTWREFKAVFNDAALDVFDSAITELHKFERIRYPDRIVEEGMAYQFVVLRAQVPAPEQGARVPAYTLVLEDVDELVGILFEKARLNPGFYLDGLSDSAKEFLLRYNQHRLI